MGQIVVDPIDQQLHRALPDMKAGPVDAGERSEGNLAETNIVEADEGQFLRNVASPTHARPENPKSKIVGRCEEGRRRLRKGQKRLRRCVAGIDIHSLKVEADFRRDRQSRGFQRLPPTFCAILKLGDALRAADISDALVAVGDEMLDCHARAAKTVDEHHVDIGVRKMATRENHTHPVAGKRRHLPIRKPDRREDDAVDLTLPHGLDDAGLAFGIAVGAREQERIAKGRGDVLGAADELRIEGISDVGHHKADCVAAAQAQPLRHPIGLITELGDRASNTGLIRRADVSCAVQVFRHRPLRHARQARHVIDRGLHPIPPHAPLITLLREGKPVLQNHGHRQACYRG